MAYSNIFQKQDVMRRVCYAITPLFIYSILLYGLNPIYQVLIAFIVGILTEYLFEKKRNKKTSEAVLVTCYLYGLSLPPNLPIWINVVGIFFAVFIAKCVFGGFGRNVYNPAITGRLFIYLSFPIALTSQYWLELSNIGSVISSSLGGTLLPSVDALSIATPLASLQAGTVPSLLHLFMGLRTGSIGEGAIFLLVLAAIYLIYTKTADWRLMVSTVLSGTILLFVLYFAGILPGFKEVIPHAGEAIKVVTGHLMAGSFIYMAVFMTTDPISGPNNKKAKWYYGIIIGLTSMIIRVFSGFPEGVSFAIMIGNTFACLLDETINQRTAAKKLKAAAVATTMIQKEDLVI